MEGAKKGTVEFVNPRKTAALSITGTRCRLNCAHCGGIYLRHMLPPEKWASLTPSRFASLLLSGGCDAMGRVPIWEVLPNLPSLATTYRINLHSGLIGEEEARRVAPYVSVVSFDFVADDDTIREVYGLSRGSEDYVKTYEMLKSLLQVVPHICIGLNGGRITGEYRAIDILARIGAEALTFIILVPTSGTRFAGVTPPPPEEVARLLEYARKSMPRTPIYLGCMRPKGSHREEVEIAAIELGVRRVVLPSRRAVEYAEKAGMEVSFREECCAL